jgi:hypothetical protein
MIRWAAQDASNFTIAGGEFFQAAQMFGAQVASFVAQA